MRGASADFFRGLRGCRGGVDDVKKACGIAVFAANSSLRRGDALERRQVRAYDHERVLSNANVHDYLQISLPGLHRKYG